MTSIDIHKIIEGPYEDEDGDWFMECYITTLDGRWGDATVYFPDFNVAYEVVAHMKKPTLEPYVYEIEENT